MGEAQKAEQLASYQDQALLTFRVGPFNFCVQGVTVESIIDPPTITEIPLSPHSIVGVFVFRGVVATAMCLRRKFGTSQGGDLRSGQVIMARVENQLVGFWVDEVKDVVEASEELDWLDIPILVPETLIEKFVSDDTGVLLFTDFEKLYHAEDSEALRESMGALARELSLETRNETTPGENDTVSNAVKEVGEIGSDDAQVQESVVVSESTSPSTGDVASSNKGDAHDSESSHADDPSVSGANVHGAGSHASDPQSVRAGFAGSQDYSKARAAGDGAGIRRRRYAATGNQSNSQRQDTSEYRRAARQSSMNSRYADSITDRGAPGYAYQGAASSYADEEGRTNWIPWALLALLALLALALLWWLFDGSGKDKKSGYDYSAPQTTTTTKSYQSENRTVYTRDINTSTPPPPVRPGTVETVAPPVKQVPIETVPPVVSETPKPSERIMDIQTETYSFSVDRPVSDTRPAEPIRSQAQVRYEGPDASIEVIKPDVRTQQTIKVANSAFEEFTHVVVKGDTLWDIAARYLGNPFKYPRLAEHSRIRDPHWIYPGDIVRIRRFNNEKK